MSQELVNAVLIALDEDTILLPNIAVAEVLSLDRLEKRGDGTSGLVGQVQWNGRSVPVVSFETLNGASHKRATSARGRITLLHSTGSQSLGVIGLLTQGYPHLVTLNREAVQPGEFRETDRPELVVARVRISSREALIPDFDTLETNILRLQNTPTLTQ